MSTTYKIKTWSCGCGYRQDFDPEDADLMALHFKDVPVGKCPACWLGQNPQRTKMDSGMQVEINQDLQTTVTVMDEQDIDQKLPEVEKQRLIEKINSDKERFSELAKQNE